MISLGAGTHVFQLDRALGEFVLTQRSIRMPGRGRRGMVKQRHLTVAYTAPFARFDCPHIEHNSYGGASLVRIEAKFSKQSRVSALSAAAAVFVPCCCSMGS